MITYLFIFAVMAGSMTSGNSSPHINRSPVWKSSWLNAGQFDSENACHNAARNLGLNTADYRCIAKVNGAVK